MRPHSRVEAVLTLIVTAALSALLTASCTPVANGGSGGSCDVAAISSTANPATYSVVFRVSEDNPIFFATAFAVDDRLLATNAHVTQGLMEFAQSTPYLDVVAVQAGTGTVVDLNLAITHPQWTGDATGEPDVGLLTTQQALPVVLDLSEDDGLTDLDIGDDIVVTGFPGDIEDQVAPTIPGVTVPQATNLTGTISALRNYDATQQVTDANVDFVQHTAATSPGMSGSSVIRCGEVVAVNNAGTVELFLTTDEQGNVTIDRVPAANNNFGVDVRHLHDIIAQFRDQSLQGFDLNSHPLVTGDGGNNDGGGAGDPNGTDWFIFDDGAGNTCGVVNGADFEAVVLSPNSEVMIVTGTDEILANTVVDEAGNITQNGQAVGTVQFAQDGDGQNTLWALAADGTALFFDAEFAGLTPGQFTNVPCDGCALVDNPVAGACP